MEIEGAVGRDDEDEVVTMAAVKNLFSAQESMLRSLFESEVSKLSERVDTLASTVSDLKTSVEYSQKEMLDLKPITAKIKAKLQEAGVEISRVQNSLEYLENQSRRNNIRVSGIPESPESWDDVEAKVKENIKQALDRNREGARVERRPGPRRRDGGRDASRDQPRTIVCKLYDWKQREAVLRGARKTKPKGLYIVAEDLALATLKKREGQIDKMKEARSADEKERENKFSRTPSTKTGSHLLRHKENGEEPPRKRSRIGKDIKEGKENYHRDDPQINVCLNYLKIGVETEKDSPVRELVRRYIRCSSRMTIGHVKKYLKLKLNLSATDQVEVMCNGEIMGKDHTLEFVYMTRWRVKAKDHSILTLQYRPKLDFS
ncbi:uncharacterized protein LOC5508582 isoform X1 [Nematostella vectensis]|uniref:uncharacterized protein LOC5508582 isoform X1 n=1 Tax=Nematostella vectensis TaxID=45351 RepID=UPI0020773BB1|nr:uncharacterized protein LOC5508582 isoform X1 [Nematostella vectensis]